MIKQYRGVDFINRDKEMELFLDYFKSKPERIMWVYGPKSTGKTTLIEYVVENHLMQDPGYNVKYINFRGKMVASYDNFIDAFIKPKNSTFLKNISATINLHFLKIDSKLYEDIKKRKLDFFEAVQEEFLNISKNKKNILIIDEIQTLQEIYMNGNRLLLNEFLNFCIRLTKETHLSHVLILTSNTIFLNQIYNNAKMKTTSSFRLIEHLPYSEIKEWLALKDVGFRQKDIELIYEYLGGSTAHIKKMIDELRYYNSLKEQLEQMAEIAKNEIKFTFKELRKIDKDYLIDPFMDIAKEILDSGSSEKDTKLHEEAVDFFCEKEILFFDPITNKTTTNSKIYVKAFENILC